jgi:methylglutaconyl-CoA hydratase
MNDAVVLSSTDRRGVATVTLNRPQVNNAYNGDVIRGLSDAVSRLGDDDSVRLLILRGNGKHFQAGADLKWLKQTANLDTENNIAVSRATANAVRGLNELAKPTIALVHGGCFGGGTGIVAACDVVIASSDAIFSISEARWGVIAGIIFPQLLAAIGLRNLRRYALSCERFNAWKAKELGLVHEVCDPGQLDVAAAPIIEGLLLSGPEALAQSKRAALELAGQIIDDDVFGQLIRQHSAKRQSAEATEGLLSFIEKRKPQWYPELPD